MSEGYNQEMHYRNPELSQAHDYNIQSSFLVAPPLGIIFRILNLNLRFCGSLLRTCNCTWFIELLIFSLKLNLSISIFVFPIKMYVLLCDIEFLKAEIFLENFGELKTALEILRKLQGFLNV